MIACITALAASLAATPALAQDASAFEGFRIEAVSGYDNTGVDFDDDFHTGGKTSQSGFLYGVAAGYDFAVSPGWTLGVEGEFSDSTSGKQHDLLSVNPLDSTPVDTEVNIDTGGAFYAGARVGFVVSPAALLYLRGGFVRQTIDIDGQVTEAGSAPVNFDDGMHVDGFRVGVGGEMMFTDAIYGKLEYRYSNYTAGQISIGDTTSGLHELFEGIDVVQHQVGVGVGMRF